MDEAEDALKPVLVQKKRRTKRGKPEIKVTPTPADCQPESPPAEPKAAQSGEPDHSLVPTPPKRLLEPLEFFRFWKSIPERERNAWFIAYPYRKLPVCDVLQPLSDEEMRLIAAKKRKAPETNCGKLAEPFNPETWERDVYEWKGAGDYHIRLNDTHPSVKGTVCETSIRGLRDWDNFPPILNENEVVLEEPLNQPYLRWARLRGIKFPGDPGTEVPSTPFDDEDEMANVSAVVESNRHLTERVIEMSKEVQRPAPAPPASPDANAAAEAVKATTQAFTETVKSINEMHSEANRNQAKAQDPAEHTKSVIEMAKVIAQNAQPPAASGNTELLSMMQMMMKQQADSSAAMIAQMEKRLEAAERRAEAADQRAQAALHPPPPAVNPAVANPVKDAIELLGALEKLKGAASNLVSTDAIDSDMPVWARVASKVIDAAPSMLHNAAVMWSGQGTPVPPPELNPEVVEAENEPPAVGPSEQPAKEQEMFSEQRIAQQIAAPLIDALNKQHKGFQFAAGMILTPNIMGFPGKAVYEIAIAQGQDGLLRILQSYPPLWGRLVLIPKQLERFIVEFFDSPTAYEMARQSQQPPQQQQAATPPQVEVLPPEKQQPNGRVVVGPDGRGIQTAAGTGKKGPIINGPVQAGNAPGQ